MSGITVKKNSIDDLPYSQMTNLLDVECRIESHPNIDSIKADTKGMAPEIYIVLYSSTREQGFGGCTLSQADYKKLKKRYSGQINFTEI